MTKPTTKSAKHLYGRGWFGLIPLIGGIVGIGLIVLGVFKYKDKKLIAIGALALFFTVAAYGSLFYYFEYSTQYRKDFSAFSRPFMNNLIKSIEFYKVEHGNYPDSLEQLIATDSLVIIFDPVSAQFSSNNKRKFYYYKIGNKYTLFSTGIDEKPYTADDIFPSSNYFDSTKTGLIMPEH